MAPLYVLSSSRWCLNVAPQNDLRFFEPPKHLLIARPSPSAFASAPHVDMEAQLPDARALGFPAKVLQEPPTDAPAPGTDAPAHLQFGLLV